MAQRHWRAPRARGFVTRHGCQLLCHSVDVSLHLLSPPHKITDLISGSVLNPGGGVDADRRERRHTGRTNGGVLEMVTQTGWLEQCMNWISQLRSQFWIHGGPCASTQEPIRPMLIWS